MKTNIHDILVKELFDFHSMAAMIWLVDRGRELEFTYGNKKGFISKDKSAKHVSLWIEENEQAFASTEELIINAIINGETFISIWNEIQLETLF